MNRRRLVGWLLAGASALFFGLALGVYRGWPWQWLSQWGALPSLATELASTDPAVSTQAADRLVEAGTEGVPCLIEAARDPRDGVRFLAVSALSRTMPLPTSAIPTLIVGLRDQDPRVRRQSALGLGRFGPDAADAKAGLVLAMRDDDPETRFEAAHAFLRIHGAGTEEVLDTLLRLLTDRDPCHFPDRKLLVPVIRRVGQEAETRAIAELIGLSEAADPRARRAAIECLQLLGPRARDAIPALRAALGDDDLLTRCLAASALSEIDGLEKGWARRLLQQVADNPGVPEGMKERVGWVLEAKLAAGSELWQPVHVLRFLIQALQLQTPHCNR